MDRFAPDVHRIVVGPRIVLWHARTGRHIALDRAVVAAVEGWVQGMEPPDQLRVLSRRLDDLHLLQESAPPDLSRLVPVRSRRVLLLPEAPALWCPVPADRTPGGYAHVERPLEAVDVRIWRACNEARTVAAVAERADATLDQVLHFFAGLTDPAVQALQLRDGPVRPRDMSRIHLVSPDRPRAERTPHMHGPSGETTLERYHAEDIVDAATHFDDRETTVSHAFGIPHPALGGQTYGQALHRTLEERSLLPADGAPTLEIGAGDGELGEAWRARASSWGMPEGEYIRLDRSPVLLEAQRGRQPGTRDILGSATDIPLPEASVGLVLCNEVIADLSAVPFDPAQPAGEGAPEQVAQRLERYGIVPRVGETLYNLGAWQMLESLHRVMAPGAAAFITEFGSMDAAPEETLQLDHPEVSIHFGQLLTVAQSLGFDAECVPLADFLGFDLAATWMARHTYEALRARMQAIGEHLRARAWTPESLEVPFEVEGLDWVPLSDEGPGPLVTRFQVLLLQR